MRLPAGLLVPHGSRASKPGKDPVTPQLPASTEEPQLGGAMTNSFRAASSPMLFSLSHAIRKGTDGKGMVGGRFGVGGRPRYLFPVLSIVVPGDEADFFIHRDAKACDDHGGEQEVNRATPSRFSLVRTHLSDRTRGESITRNPNWSRSSPSFPAPPPAVERI